MSGDTTSAVGPWPNHALPQGTIVNGYRIEQVLGSGGFGITYLARDLLQQPFAIKEYYPRQLAVRRELNVMAASAEDAPLFEEWRQRFLREAQALVLLSRVDGAGDGIVRVRTYFEAHGTCFLVMDYVAGDSLDRVLQREPGGLAAALVRALLAQLLSAIDVVHRAGLMHRDIKPANIILRDGGKVVLIDFGASREATSGQTTGYTKIYSGGYAPPEQMSGMRQGSFSDIYAIGAVCYRAIGGSLVDAMARQSALAAGRPDPQPPAGRIGAGRYPAPLLAAIDAALTIDVTERPNSAIAILDVLGRDEPVAAQTAVVGRARSAAAPRRSHQQRETKRRRGVWAVAAGAGALALAGAAYLLLLRSPAAPPSAGRQLVAAGTPAPAPSPPVATTPPVATRPSVATPPPVATRPPVVTSPPQRSNALPPAGGGMMTPASAPTDKPGAAPTPAPPTEPTQRQAMAGLSPAPAASPADAATKVEPTQVPPIEPAQRQAMVVPPMAAAPLPAAPAPPSPLERAQAAARSLPCAILHVTSGQDGLHVSGLAPAGQELNRLLAELSRLDRIAEDVTRVGRFACKPMATMDALVRQTWDAGPSTFAIRLDQREVVSGARLGIDVATTLPALYVDLYQGDGLVHHLLRPSAPGRPGAPHVEWMATPPPGPRLVVAIGSASPLDLGARPEAEKAADYLTLLQTELQRSGMAASADVAVVTVRAAEAVGRNAPKPHPANVRSDRCANIVSRVQMGETLTDAERTTLSTECRS
ncbi:MAG TPA: serine/threonine-protein kinase [Acetobacteraceae bacterium]|nr:serine/threonine-protein kinase [Acetobacteraceae bacterium]